MASPVQVEKPRLLFLVLLAVTTSLSALGIEMMLPTLQVISAEFALKDANAQHIITIFILGLFFGEIIFGPMSDCYGRKPLIIGGSLAFMLGSVLCAMATSYEQLLLARVLQGFGAAGPKIAIRAILRDLYSGNALAKVFSLMYTILMIIPMTAPLIGQWVTVQIGWQGLFISLSVFCFCATLVFHLIQPETLPRDKRSKFNFLYFMKTLGLIFAHQKVLLMTIMLGIIFSINLTYLSTAQQMFSVYYDINQEFPVYFAALASAIGLGYILSARLVNSLGGLRLCIISLYLLVTVTLLLVSDAWSHNGIPPLWHFIACFYVIFVCYGILWANIAVLAVEYLGAAAGLGSTFISAGATLIAFALTSVSGSLFDSSFIPLGLAFFGMSLAAAVLFYAVCKSKHHHCLQYVTLATREC